MSKAVKPEAPQKVDYNDAVAESKKYFDGDDLAATVWVSKLIHKLFTKRQNMRPTFMGRTFAADGMSGNGYFAATASISTSAPIGSAATW